MIRYACTVFLSAFLLFQIQPIIARFILPWFGGTALVWTTCMMFFQFALLLGYLYAHVLRRCFQPRLAWGIHIGVLLGASLLLRQTPPESMKPIGGENMTWAIVALLTVTVGLPFFALSATGPLVQAWHSISHRGRSTPRQTYRLYALSNLGSILALVSYPFVFELTLVLPDQARLWSIGFLVFAAFCFWSGSQTWTFTRWDGFEGAGHHGETVEKIDSQVPIPKPGWGLALTWVILAMIPSVLLLAITNLMCQEVASIPFLWILPLSLYLVSLIICFDRPALYRRFVFWPLTILGIIVSVLLLHISNQASLPVQVLGYSSALFFCCMTSHGELERLKPPREWLTLFYLMVSLGGALGGVLVVVVAPNLFNDFYELHFGWLLCIAIPCAVKVWEVLRHEKPKASSAWVMASTGLIAAATVLCSLLFFWSLGDSEKVIVKIRNEYGVVSVEQKTPDRRVMVNGRTEQGGQFTSSDREMEPSGYYVDGCGPALAVRALREKRRSTPGTMKIGLVGLGTALW